MDRAQIFHCVGNEGGTQERGLHFFPGFLRRVVGLQIVVGFSQAKGRAVRKGVPWKFGQEFLETYRRFLIFRFSKRALRDHISGVNRFGLTWILLEKVCKQSLGLAAGQVDSCAFRQLLP